jgi:hypothetical protein
MCPPHKQNSLRITFGGRGGQAFGLPRPNKIFVAPIQGLCDLLTEVRGRAQSFRVRLCNLVRREKSSIGSVISSRRKCG